MKSLSFGTFAAFAAVFLLLFPNGAGGQEQYPSRVSLTFDRFYAYEEMSRALHELARAYPELLAIQSIGHSVEGRDIWLVTINNAKTGPDAAKPAMYIDGNVHGNEIQAAEVCLYTIWYLTKSHGRVPRLTALLDSRAFYIIPMVNPDGREYWFTAPNNAHSSRISKKPYDNDHDGVADEDGYDDLDGDGMIVEMRRRDPLGKWRVSNDDPRLMERVEPGQPGEYERLGSEGLDNDGDGAINEDGPGGFDMNRDWPADWQPAHIQFGAADYPLSHPETRCIAEFISNHPNIAGAQSYHNAGGMILRGPGQERLDKTYSRSDLRVYDAIAQRGEQMLPFYKYMKIWKDLYPVSGGFVNWVYEDLGIFAFTNELWTSTQYYNRENLTPKERIQYDDWLLFGQTFAPWHEYDHPTYGKIEIGGWSKWWGRIPPPFMLEELCHRNMAFTLYHAEQIASLDFAEVEVKPLGDGLHELTVQVRNKGIIPTISDKAREKKVGARDAIVISPQAGSSVQVLTGGTLSDRFLAAVQPVERRPERIWVDEGIGGEDARWFRWILSGTGNVMIRYTSDKAANIEKTITIGP